MVDRKQNRAITGGGLGKDIATNDTFSPMAYFLQQNPTFYHL